MKTQPKTPEKKEKIVDLQMSPSEIPPKKKGEIEDLQMSSPEVQIEDLLESPPEIPLKKKGENRRSSDVFSRGLNRRSIRRKTVSAKENYAEINKTGPPNQRPETLTGQKSFIRNLQR